MTPQSEQNRLTVFIAAIVAPLFFLGLGTTLGPASGRPRLFATGKLGGIHPANSSPSAGRNGCRFPTFEPHTRFVHN